MRDWSFHDLSYTLEGCHAHFAEVAWDRYCPSEFWATAMWWGGTIGGLLLVLFFFGGLWAVGTLVEDGAAQRRVNRDRRTK